MFTLPRGLTLGGHLAAHDDVTVSGRVQGEIWADGRLVAIADGGRVDGQIVALDVTVEGVATGLILASGTVEILGGGLVDGRIVAPDLVVHEGSQHIGVFEPHRVDAAFRVARHRRATTDVVDAAPSVGRVERPRR